MTVYFGAGFGEGFQQSPSQQVVLETGGGQLLIQRPRVIHQERHVLRYKMKAYCRVLHILDQRVKVNPVELTNIRDILFQLKQKLLEMDNEMEEDYIREKATRAAEIEREKNKPERELRDDIPIETLLALKKALENL